MGRRQEDKGRAAKWGGDLKVRPRSFSWIQELAGSQRRALRKGVTRAERKEVTECFWGPNAGRTQRQGGQNSPPGPSLFPALATAPAPHWPRFGYPAILNEVYGSSQVGGLRLLHKLHNCRILGSSVHRSLALHVPGRLRPRSLPPASSRLTSEGAGAVLAHLLHTLSPHFCRALFCVLEPIWLQTSRAEFSLLEANSARLLARLLLLLRMC